MFSSRTLRSGTPEIHRPISLAADGLDASTTTTSVPPMGVVTYSRMRG